ncbi:ADP-ribosylglycohydrolase family protein [Paenibacillus sp. GCM10027626]|uniref:ADP-ribosylglycohydrolase family protein n=1 Tax=Paenibacillus sp. GCM10027626 TaxID=3273411 RepID=UPI003637FF54
MRTISYEMYLNKVYGAWIGKSIAGTIGAPYEGRKELFEYEYDPKAIQEMFPNDDLDLQVLWLDVMERKGIYIDSEDLAEAFYEKVPYAPGEYAVFKKNYARGIHPPLSGAFNNRYYVNGMGCPIRSEFWACVSPGNPALAAEYAAKDGILDHEGDSVYMEQFWSAVEAEAFFETDLNRLFGLGLKWLPEGTKIRRLVEDTIRWSKGESDWIRVREWIIRDYGHPDCTNLYQNTGFTLLSLIHGEKEFIRSTMIALNCGYDTDCTCATAGALLGIIHGAEYLIETYQFCDTSYKLSIDLTRPSLDLYSLAVDTCRAGLTVAAELNKEVIITAAPEWEPLPTNLPRMLHVDVDYGGVPAIGLGEKRRLTLRVSKYAPQVPDMEWQLTLKGPKGWIIALDARRIELGAGSAELEISVEVPPSLPILMEQNLFELTLSSGRKSQVYTFGLAGAAIWSVHGPFWENVRTPIPTELGEWYFKELEEAIPDPDERTDITRQFHLNAVVDMEKAYLVGAADEPVIRQTYEDLISVSDFVGYQGPCVVYAERQLYCPEERVLHVMIGHTDAYELWLNGTCISKSEQMDWWTAENKHCSNIKLNAGRNVLLLKCIRRGAHAEYSLNFSEKGSCQPLTFDLGSYNVQ